MIGLGWKRLFTVISVAWLLIIGCFATYEYQSINVFEQFDSPIPKYSFWQWSQLSPTINKQGVDSQYVPDWAKEESSNLKSDEAKANSTKRELTDEEFARLGTDKFRHLELRLLRLTLTLIVPIIFIWVGAWALLWVRDGFRKGK